MEIADILPVTASSSSSSTCFRVNWAGLTKCVSDCLTNKFSIADAQNKQINRCIFLCDLRPRGQTQYPRERNIGVAQTSEPTRTKTNIFFVMPSLGATIACHCSFLPNLCWYEDDLPGTFMYVTKDIPKTIQLPKWRHDRKKEDVYGNLASARTHLAECTLRPKSDAVDDNEDQWSSS